jgi:hypothetical protein
MMAEADLRELAEDVRRNGLRAPITLLDGKILDGRNRYKACLMAETHPRFREFGGDGDPLDFVISANFYRRHLTESQRAMVAAKVATMREGRPSKTASRDAVSQASAAKQFDVSRASVTRAKKVLSEASPEDIKAVEQGEKTVTEVARETKAKAEKPKEQLDKTGHPVPAAVLDEWRRAEETARRMLSQISSLRSELKSALKEGDPVFAEVTNTTCADLDNAYTSIKCVTPYAVCTSCQGHGRKKCGLCRGRGFISEFAWRSFVPAEIKSMRGGKAA